MRVRRLGWAGLEVEADGASVVVDLVVDAGPFRSVLPRESMVVPRNKATAALVTHLHRDHADPDAIEKALTADGEVLRPKPLEGSASEQTATARAEAGFAERDLDVRVMAEWDTVSIGPFEITAVPAVDGLGDPQVNWVIVADGKRIFHGGDTVFHGFWWLIANRFGPFDAAFLPINGAVVNFPHLAPPSPLPADLTPEQAVVAGTILQAQQVVPIHYGIDVPPFYVEVDDPATAFQLAAKKYDVTTNMVAVDETIDI